MVSFRGFPIWARIAARILPTMGASTDVERFFKVMKGVSTDNRPNLLPDMLEILACLHEWLAEEYEYGEKRLCKRDERFTSINSALELQAPTSLSTYDSGSDEDDDSDSDAED